MTRAEQHTTIIKHYKELGFEIIAGKGGFWIRKDDRTTFVAGAQAAKAAGITPQPRQPRKVALPWGDYAIIAMLNR